MKALYCPKCGAPNLEKQGQNYKCPHCGSLLADDYVQTEKERIKSLFSEALAGQKEEQIANLRKNLWNAAREENISSVKVLQYAREIKKLLPEDFMANFYEVACGENVKSLNKFLNNVNDKLGGIYAADIAQFLVRGMEYSTVLPLKNLISRHLKDGEYKKYMTAVEDEAQKIKNGVYSPQVPRDVFLAYSSKDYEAVNEIVEFLEENGISCFVALRNLRHGKGSVENYGNELKTAIHNCKCVVFLSSNNSRSLECDALKIELPYIRDNEPKMGRIEYLLEEYTNTNFAARAICEEFFKDLEYCRDKEDLIRRILGYITGFKEEKPLSKFKYCMTCGAENPQKTNFCMECGSREFVATHEEYALKKQQKEYEKLLGSMQKKESSPPQDKDLGGKYITLGYWPQSKKAEGVKISGDADSSGYFLGSDGNRYAQVDSLLYYKVEPLRWRVLKERDGRALVLCGQIIDGRPFDLDSNNYENSDIRCWLNGEFLNRAFGPADRAKILTVAVENGVKSTMCGQNGYVCRNTNDKVFLLSREEAYGSGLGYEERSLCVTDYAKGAGAYHYEPGGHGVWWLRSPYGDEELPMGPVGVYTVELFGRPGKATVFCATYGVAPAMWIDLLGNGSADNRPKKSVRLPKDEFITFGSWPQGKKAAGVNISGEADLNGYRTGSDGGKYAQAGDGFYKVEPIKWRVLQEEDGVALLQSEKILFNGRYAPSKNNYAKSEIRALLNGEFLNKAFTAEEREIVLTSEVDNGLFGTGDESNPNVCGNTADKVFLPSYEEAFKIYSPTPAQRQKKPTDLALVTEAWASDGSGNGWWWLRTPYSGNTAWAGSVSPDGRCEWCSVGLDSLGVAPMLKIRYGGQNARGAPYKKVQKSVDGSAKIPTPPLTLQGLLHGLFPRGAAPVTEGDTVLFGKWPQSKKAAGVEITGACGNGYFVGSDGCSYAQSGGEYFKVEPIRWNILAQSGGHALLLCQNIIASRPYDFSKNGYLTSDIRRWLNGEFFTKAFEGTARRYIVAAAVDNSPKSAGLKNSANACADSKDNVFLLGRAEAFAMFGLSDTFRQKVATDYAAAAAGGFWWLRSPCAESPSLAYCVDGFGRDGKNKINDRGVGVVPAIYIRFKSPKGIGE